jgi:WD40 repeat protein
MHPEDLTPPNWREEILREAVAEGWIDGEQASSLRRADLTDDEFIHALSDSIGTSEPASARLVRLALGLEPAKEADVHQDLPTGVPETIGERYRLARLIGSGGMGSVYLAHDLVLNRAVAIKVPASRVLSREAEQRLERERRVLAQWDDPHLVSVYDAGQLPGGQPYFVMPYVEGEAIDEFVRRTGSTDHELLKLFLKVARAIGSAHRQGVIHRDLKPAHLLITLEGEPVVIDFGLAKGVDGTTSSDVTPDGSNSNRSSTLLGTEGYMAPELVGEGLLTPACDVYSLGVVLRELLAITPSGPGRTRRAEIDAVVNRCLAQQPADRYFTAADLADDLDNLLRHQPTRAVTVGRPWYVARKFLERHRWSLGLAGVLLVIVAGSWWEFTRRLWTERDRAVALRLRAEAGEESAFHEKERAQSLLLKQSLDAAKASLKAKQFDDARTALSRVPKTLWGWECDRLWLESCQTPRPTRVVGWHDWGLSALLLSSDEQTMISAGLDGRIVRWDKEHPDGKDLVLGRWDEEKGCWAQAWPPSSVAESTSLESWSVLAWLEQDKRLLAGSLSGRLDVLDVPTGEIAPFFRHARPITAFASSEDQSTFALGDEAGRLVLLRANGESLGEWDSAEGAILDIDTLPGGGWILTTAKGGVQVRSIDGSQEIASVEIAGPVWDVDRSADGRLAFAGAMDAVSLYEWNERESRLIHLADLRVPDDERGRPSALHAVAWSNDASLLAAEDDRGRLLVWEVATRSLLAAVDDQTERPLQGDALAKLPLVLQRRTSALRFASSPEKLFSAGHDTTIKEWRLPANENVVKQRFGPNPVGAFGSDGTWWVGDAGGQVQVVDLPLARVMQTIDAHDHPVRSISAARHANRVATTDGDEIVIWQKCEDDVIEAFQRWTPPTPVRSIAFHPKGILLAAVDKEGGITLWNTESLAVKARRSTDEPMGGDRRASAVFNSDGSRLAIMDGSAALRVFDGTSLAEIERPSLFGGSSGSAIAWHPRDPDRLVGGNVAGRIQFLPETSMLDNTTKHFRDQPIVSIAFTPSGNRIAAASAEGQIVLVEPNDWGPIHTLTSGHAKEAPLVEIGFDPRRQRLHPLHSDGVAEIWDAYPQSPQADDQTSRWKRATLLEGNEARELFLREPAIAVGKEDHLGMLILRATETPSDGVATREVLWGEWRKEGFRSSIMYAPGKLSSRGRDALHRSLALMSQDGRHYAAIRRARPDVRTTAGELLILRDDVTGENGASDSLAMGGIGVPWSAEGTGPPGEGGFDVAFVPRGKDVLPALVHFSHAGNRLWYTHHQGDHWESRLLGRQGDGFRLKGASGPEGSIHLIFDSTRFNQDPLGGVYLHAHPHGDMANLTREFLDPALRDHTLSVAVDHEGRPLVLLATVHPSGVEQLEVRRRDQNSWRTLAEIPVHRARQIPSNLVVSPTKEWMVALIDDASSQLRLWRKSDDGVLRVEIVANLSDSIARSGSDDGWVGPFLRLDSQSQPLLLLGRRSLRHGWLRLWQRVSSP